MQHAETEVYIKRNLHMIVVIEENLLYIAENKLKQADHMHNNLVKEMCDLYPAMIYQSFNRKYYVYIVFDEDITQFPVIFSYLSLFRGFCVLFILLLVPHRLYPRSLLCKSLYKEAQLNE